MSRNHESAGERWLDLHGIWMLIRWHVKTIATLVLVMAAAGIILAARLETEFSAEASVRIDKSAYGSGADHDSLPSMESPPERSSTEMALLRSRSVIEQAIAHLREHELPKESQLPREVQSPDMKSGRAFTQEALADINRMRKALDVAEVGKDSGVLRLTYRARDAGEASATLRAIIDSYLELKRVHFAIQVAKEEAILDGQLPLLEKQLEFVRERSSRMSGGAQISDIDRESDRLTAELGMVESAIGRLSGERSDAARRYKDTHPAYRSLMEKMAYFTKRKEEIKRQISSLPDKWQESSELLSDKEKALQTYAYLIEKRHRLGLLKVKDMERTWVVDDVSVTEIRRAWPRRVQAVIGGAVTGGLVGALYALWKYMALGFVYFSGDLRALGFKPLVGKQGSKRKTAGAIARAVHVMRRGSPCGLQNGQLKLVAIGDGPTGELIAAQVAAAWVHSFSEQVLVVVYDEHAIGRMKLCLADDGWRESCQEGIGAEQTPHFLSKGSGVIAIIFRGNGLCSETLSRLKQEFRLLVFSVSSTDRIAELPLHEEPMRAAIFHVPEGKRKCAELSEHRDWAIGTGVNPAEIYALLD